MKKLILAALIIFTSGSSLLAQTSATLSPKEEREGYTLLFNGTNTDGWHAYLKIGPGAWHVTDGVIQLDPNAPGQADLITNSEYENFDLKLEWKISTGGNSGIIFPVHEDTTYSETYLTGLEMQVLDDVAADDNKKANHLAGSLYDMLAPAHPAKPAGEWNAVEIKKLDGRLTFWLNGKKVVNIKIGSKKWNELFQQSKFKAWKGFLAYPKGHIALQDHGYAVAFRNIRIKELDTN